MFFNYNSQEIYRLRRRYIRDPYDGTERLADWDDYGTPPDRQWIRGFIAPGSTLSTDQVGRLQVQDAWTLYMPDGTADIMPGDRIQARLFDRDRVFDVDGHPEFYENPFPGLSFMGTVVHLKASTG